MEKKYYVNSDNLFEKWCIYVDKEMKINKHKNSNKKKTTIHTIKLTVVLLLLQMKNRRKLSEKCPSDN